MLEEGTRHLDLYDIISILLPGSALTAGLLPFLPQRTDVSSTFGIILIIVVGFIFGRGITAIGIRIEDFDKPTSHREYFEQELRSPSNVDQVLADRFFMVARIRFNLHELPQARADLDDDDQKAVSSLYSHVRSFIHMDGRGRSRTFQAILDFCRGMVVASGILFFVYVGYAVALLSDLLDPSFVPYQSYIGEFDFDPLLVILLASGVFAASYLVFEGIRSNYREYFVQYLMIDFLVLTQHS